MKKRVMLGIVVVLLLIPQSLLAINAVASISASTGDVKVIRNNRPISGRKGLVLNDGDIINTEKNAKVRTVFNGEVMAIQVSKRGNPSVLIRHGNYISVYKNLSKIYVKKGDKVTTKQSIGEVFTNPSTNETILSFIVFKDAKTQNPAHWIYRM